LSYNKQIDMKKGFKIGAIIGAISGVLLLIFSYILSFWMGIEFFYQMIAFAFGNFVGHIAIYTFFGHKLILSKDE